MIQWVRTGEKACFIQYYIVHEVTRMRIFFNKKRIRWIAIALALVLCFDMPAGDYVNSGGTAKAAGSSTESGDKSDNDAPGSVSDETTEDDEAEETEKKLPENLDYVSDVRLFHAQSKDKAKQACKKAGYTLLDSDLNSGTSKNAWEDFWSDEGDGAYVYMGYKTTKDRNDAITSMKMCEMDTGYQSFDYDEIEANMNTGMNMLAEDIVTAVAETKKNIEDGDAYAEKVREGLNLFYVPYMDNKGLGDAIFESDAGKISQLLKRSSTVVIVNIFSYLTMGVSGTKVSGLDGNFAERIVAASEKVGSMMKSEYVTLDSLYKDSVKDIRDSLKDFSNMLEPSIKAYQEAGNSLNDSFIENHTEDALNVQAYNRLNKYTLSDGTGVGTYLYRLGTSSLKSKEDIRKAYPLVMALSPGQLVMFPYTGLIDAANYLEVSSDALSDGDQLMAEVQKKIKETGLKETADGRIPIYPGENDSLYRARVAMTSEAIRAASAREEYHKITQYEKNMEVWDEVFTWGNRVLIFAMAAHFLGKAVSWAMVKMGLKWMFKTVVGRSFSYLAMPTKILSGMATFILFAVVMLVWYVANKLDELADYYNPDWSEVPGYMYSVEKIKKANGKKESQYLLYRPVFNVDANKDKLVIPEYKPVEYGDSSSTIIDKRRYNKSLISDFNAKQGKKWNALYITKDPNAGSPICGENINDIFLVKKGEYRPNISGYQAYSSFGNENAVNLNSNQYSDHDGGIYLYYRTENSILDPEAVSFKVDGKYVSDVILISEDEEKDAKAAIKLKAGKYNFLDQNLTPDQGCYTYIGYATTENIDDAIRDLRVDPVNTGNSMGGGYRRNDIGYASTGTSVPDKDGHCITLYQTAVNKGETVVSGKSDKEKKEDAVSGGAALVEEEESSTVMSYSGAPILADFMIVDSLDKAPVGYEPIISGCGGAAFNFNTRYKKDSDSKRRYVYYQPAVSYIRSGTEVEEKKGVTYVTSDEEYVAGVQAFAIGGKNRREKLKERAEKMGYKVFEVDLLNKYYKNKEKEEDRKSTISCYLGYATTINPFRAIGDIRYYKGTTYSKTLQYSAGSPEGTWIGMDVNVFGRGINSGKAYCGASDDLLFAADRRNAKNGYEWNGEDAESWQDFIAYGYYAERELYILAADADHPALKPSDILVTKQSSAPSGMRPISYMTNKASGINYDLSCDQDGVYFYINRPEEVKKKYISGIYVSSFKLQSGLEKMDKWMAIKGADDATMLAAGAASDGEVISTNIAVKPEYAWYNLLDGCDYDTAKKKKKYTNKTSILYDDFTIYWKSRSHSSTMDVTRDPQITIPDAARHNSYVGVSRTDDPDEALTGIIRYKFGKGTPPSKITIGGVKYTKAGDAVGDCCYYTTKSDNAMPGLPITDISFDEDLSLGGSAVLLQTDRTDPSDLQQKLDAIDLDDDLEDFEKIRKKAEVRNQAVNLKPLYQNKLSGHLFVDNSDTFITDIILGHGNSKEEAVNEAIKKGASYVYSFDTNMGVGTSVVGDSKGLEFGSDSMEPTKTKTRKYVCIGYNAESTWSGGDPSYGVHDILITHGKPYSEDGFEKNGGEYYPVSDISLNDGTDGEELYMYYSFDKTDKANSPLESLVMSKGDSIPEGAGQKRYEYIMTDTGEKANLNRGATTVSGDKMQDIRLWLFVHRLDNTVKSEALFDITDTGRKTVRMDAKIFS